MAFLQVGLLIHLPEGGVSWSLVSPCAHTRTYLSSINCNWVTVCTYVILCAFLQVGLFIHLPEGGRILESRERQVVRFKGSWYYYDEPLPDPQPLQVCVCVCVCVCARVPLTSLWASQGNAMCVWVDV